MRIINGRDYYDSALGYGIDKTVMFIRKKELQIPEDALPAKLMNFRNYAKWNEPSLDGIQIHFCGKTYYGVRLHAYKPYKLDLTKYCWSFEKLEFEMAAAGYTLGNDLKKDLRQFFANSGNEIARDRLIKLGITIAILTSMDSHYHPLFWHVDSDELKEYGFAQVKDPFTAFQEISMWISGVLVEKRRQPPQIVDEKIRIAKRGFDPKWSFRREKGDKQP